MVEEKALSGIEFADFGHIGLCEREIENVEVIPDVGGISRAGDNHIAALDVPAEHDLGAGLAVFGGQLREHRLLDQALVAMPQRLPGHQADAVGSQ